MDKKAKKRIEVLRGKLKSLEQKLVGARQQEDEPGEISDLEQQIEAVHAEMKRLREGS